MNTQITNLVHDFFQKMGISFTALTVDFGESEIDIRVETSDSAILIGMHGKTIESLAHLLGRMIEKISKQYVHVHLEINDYMKSKDERLFRFIDSKVSLVTSTGKSIRIPNLNPFERKKAHGYISEKKIEGLSTYSDGEKMERVLVLEFSGTVIRNAPSPKSPPTLSHSAVDDLSEDGVGI